MRFVALKSIKAAEDIFGHVPLPPGPPPNAPPPEAPDIESESADLETGEMSAEEVRAARAAVEEEWLSRGWNPPSFAGKDSVKVFSDKNHPRVGGRGGKQFPWNSKAGRHCCLKGWGACPTLDLTVFDLHLDSSIFKHPVPFYFYYEPAYGVEN